MSVEVDYAALVTVKETLETGVPAVPAAYAVVTHNGYNSTENLTSASSVPVTKVAVFSQALTAGSATIDLTSLTGTMGAAVDGTGLKLQILKAKSIAANTSAITIAEGASNGYALLGASFTLNLLPGQEILLYGNEAAPDVGATDKTIDLSGTGTESLEIVLVFG